MICNFPMPNICGIVWALNFRFEELRLAEFTWRRINIYIEILSERLFTKQLSLPDSEVLRPFIGVER